MLSRMPWGPLARSPMAEPAADIIKQRDGENQWHRIRHDKSADDKKQAVEKPQIVLRISSTIWVSYTKEA